MSGFRVKQTSQITYKDTTVYNLHLHRHKNYSQPLLSMIRQPGQYTLEETILYGTQTPK